jgi:DNA-binding SARP family transcriptional activator
VFLLGNFQVRLDNQPALSLEGGKASELLAYLVVESDRPHSRHALAELLWPDRSPVEALNSLRFALSKLRTTLQDRQSEQPLLLVSRSQVQLNPQAEIGVDVITFRCQASACEADAQAGARPVLAALKSALSLYRGSFLQGFPLGDSLDFETWALSQRERVDYQRLRLLDLLAQCFEAEGQFQPAEEILRGLLAERPWDEEAHRRLIHLLAGSGQHSAALAQYEACRRALAELGAEPNHATHQLYQQIKQSLPTVTGASTSVFVARQPELARMDAFLERSLAGQEQVVLISGEAGSGKTALISEFTHRAQAVHPDLLAAGGQCDAYLGIGQPYQPFMEAVQMLTGGGETLPWAEHLPPKNQARLYRALPWVAQTLVETAPVLLNHFVNRPELARSVRLALAENPSHLKPAWLQSLARHAGTISPPLETGLLHEQFTRFCAAISRQAPLLLILDDLHWSDPGSAALLFHLARRLTTCRILILAAYRSGEVKRPEGMAEHPLAGILTELRRYGGNIHINLDSADEQAFISAFLQQDPQLQPNRLDESFRNALSRRTGGNPLFTTELLRSLQARGDLFLSTDGSWESRPTLDWSHLPERVEAVIAGRIKRLSPVWREWLITASVEGETFTAEALAQVHGIEAQALLEVLNGALGLGLGGQRLVQAEGVQWITAPDGRLRSLSRYRFGHILFQTYLYQQLSQLACTQRHAAVAAALENLYGSEATRHAPALARHFELGGIPEKAAAYHLEAGRQAALLASGAAAVRAYQRGLKLLAGLPHTPGAGCRSIERLEIELYLALGAPFLLAEGWGGVEREKMIQKALECIQKMGLEAAEGAEKPRKSSAAFDISTSSLFPALFAQADWLISQGELQQATHLGEEMLALAGTRATTPFSGLSPDKGLVLILAHRILGFSCLFQGEFLQARHHLETLLEIYIAIGQPSMLSLVAVELDAICRSALGLVLMVLGYPEQGWRQATQALSRARGLKHPPTLGSALVFASEIPVLSQDVPAFQQIASELAQLGQANELRFFQAYGLGNDGYAQVLAAAESGNAEQMLSGVEKIRKGMSLWESTGTRAGRGQWVSRLAHACLIAGQIDDGLAITAQVLALPGGHGIEAGLAQIHRLHGELLLQQASPARDTAETHFVCALKIARQQGAQTYALKAAISLARLWQVERPQEAHNLLEETCAWFTEGQGTQDWHNAQALLGERA